MTSNLKIRSLNTRGIALDERLYKKKWGQNTFFSHGESNSKGVCTIVPKFFPGKCELHFSDLEGRILIIKATIDDTNYFICNVYLPTSNHETNQLEVLSKLNDQITDISASNIIMGGDWNIFSLSG